MDSLRRVILALILYLGVVFNLQRFDNLDGGEVGIMTFVYVLIVLAALFPLLLPLIVRYSVYYVVGFWLIVYLLLRLVVFNTRPLFGGEATYFSIAEMTLLTLAVIFGYMLEEHLVRYEHLIEKITFSESEQHRILSIRQAADEIKTEFIRSRRHNHPITAVVIEMRSNQLHYDLQHTLHEVQSLMAHRYISASLAKVIYDQARRTDVIMEEGKNGRYVLLCPETDAMGSQVLAERIETLVNQQLGLDIAWGVASFPADALTFDDLLRAAEQQMENKFKIVLPIGATTQGEEFRTGSQPDSSAI